MTSQEKQGKLEKVVSKVPRTLWLPFWVIILVSTMFIVVGKACIGYTAVEGLQLARHVF